MAYKSPLAAPPRPDEDGYINLYGTDFFEFGMTWSFDRGPYYLHALIHLLGPVQRVTGSAQNPWKEHPQAKEKVRTPTHFAAVLDFTNGVVATLFLTSEVHPTHLPHIEIYGTEGSLRCTDPNNFGGSLFLRKPEEEEMVPVECAFGYNENSRGVGVADLASALRSGRPHRANGEMGYHVIDIVHALHEASEQERHVVLESTCDQPTPLPQAWRTGRSTDGQGAFLSICRLYMENHLALPAPSPEVQYRPGEVDGRFIVQKSSKRT